MALTSQDHCVMSSSAMARGAGNATGWMDAAQSTGTPTCARGPALSAPCVGEEEDGEREEETKMVWVCVCVCVCERERERERERESAGERGGGRERERERERERVGEL